MDRVCSSSLTLRPSSLQHACIRGARVGALPTRPLLARPRSAPCQTKWTLGTATVFPNGASRDSNNTSSTPNTLGEVTQKPETEPTNGANGVVAAATEAAAPPTSSFPWSSQWYPVAVLADLDPRQLHATHLLGTPLVLWRDAQGAWSALEDKCPHRLAPLSEGRIESDGSLQCAYHGWQFDGTGACTHIPQLRGDDKAQRVACASRRSCVRSFPVQVAHGLLWVRPDSSQRAHDEFAADPSPPPHAIRELLGGPEVEGWQQTTQWYVRDVPIRWDTMLENVVDASHTFFAHHGVQAHRSGEKGTTTRVAGELRPDGFEFEVDTKNPRFHSEVSRFVAPSLVRFGNAFRSLAIFGIPTRPGWSRMYVVIMKDTRRPEATFLPWIFLRFYNAVERLPWLHHPLMLHPVLDGDNYLLHAQERTLQEEGGDWRRRYYMPAPADASVSAFRRWIDVYGGAVPTCEPGAAMPPLMPRREVLDRHHQHTQHCSHCRRALRNVDVVAGVAAVASAVAAAWLLARGLLGLPLLAAATALGLLGLGAAVALGMALRALRQLYVFTDYVHAFRD